MNSIIGSLLIFISVCSFCPVSGGAEAVETRNITIDTPDLCTKVEKVSGNIVHLRSGQGNCSAEGMGKAEVSVDAGLQEISIYVDGRPWKERARLFFGIEGISDTMVKSKKSAEQLEVPKNHHGRGALLKAQELSTYYQSEVFQDKLKLEQDRLKNEVFGSGVTSYYPQAPAKAISGKLSSNERIYIFISSSMPVETVRNYVKAVSRLKDPNIRLVMRGFIGGLRHIKPTMAFIKKLLLEDPSCDPLKTKCSTFAAQVTVDPMLFGKYAINKAPAIVYSPSVSVVDEKMSEGLGANVKVSTHYLLYGDVGLDYAIEQILKETKSAGLERALAAYRGTFYN